MIYNYIIFEKYWKISKIRLMDICDMFNIDFNDLNYLSSGSYGDAYKFNNKVLKITSDVREFNDVKKLIGKKRPGIVKYYDAKIYTQKCFAIIMEYVKPLENYLILMKYDLDIISDFLDIICFNWNDINNLNDYIILIQEDYDLEQDDKYFNIIKKFYKLYSKIKQLKQYPDLHVGNLGIDSNNEIVMFDFNKLY